MRWGVEYTNEFGTWWTSITDSEQEDVATVVELLMETHSMSGRHDVRELTNSFTPERRKRVETRKAELRAAMPLHELRQARAMTQRALGEALHVNQPAVAKLERRTDMYVSNLRA